MGLSPTVYGVLFDFEGTLVDFQWRLELGEAELRQALLAHGFDADLIAPESYAQMWNRAAAAAADPQERAALDDWLGVVYDRWDDDALSRWSTRDGAADLLRRVRETGLRSGVVSNIGRSALTAALARFGLTDSMDVIVSRNDVQRMKPDGEGIRTAAQRLGLPLDRVLMVGDSVTDVRAARDAGVRVAILRGGESSSDALAAEPPDHHVDHLSEVGPLVGL